jgi:dihydrofolate reductase/thymidylate synthase
MIYSILLYKMINGTLFRTVLSDGMNTSKHVFKRPVREFDIITAYLEHNRGIGYKNKLPWKSIPEDMNFFKNITTKTYDSEKKNAIIMGGNTFRSMNKKPLPDRYNIVISRTYNNRFGQHDNLLYCDSLDNALRACNKVRNIENVYTIGGQQIYEEAIKKPECKRLYVTCVKEKQRFKADTFFPEIPDNFKLMGELKTYSYTADCDLNFQVYNNRYDCNSSEYEYLNLLDTVLREGEEVYNERTGESTISSFHRTATYDIETLNPDETDQAKLRYRVPIFTTKKVYYNGSFREILWMLRGYTNVKWLQERKVYIWNGNSTREFLDKNGLYDYPEGELGPVYGSQWINWNDEGINQIQGIIDELRRDPSSRRAVLTAWNPSKLGKMALPPCHWSYEFMIANNKLNCKVNMRSNDLLLGHPFNVCGGSILTILISRALNILPGQIAMSITNAHIYKNHVPQVKEQLTRTPYKFSILTINKEINDWNDMVELDSHVDKNNFKLEDYEYWPALPAKMAV